MTSFVRGGLYFAIALAVTVPVQAQRQQATEAAPAAPPALSAEAQAAYDALAPQNAGEIELHMGWFRDRQIMYYGFGASAQPVVVGRVLWPIHGFDLKGNPVAIRGQRPIFSTIPGLKDYSGVYRLTYIVTADRVQPNTIRDAASADALVSRGRARRQETNLAFNLPIVPKGSTLARDTTTAATGWYEGRDVYFFDFGQVQSSAAPMMGFVRGDVGMGDPDFVPDQFPVIDTLSTSAPYQDLWELKYVRTDTAYTANSVRSAAALGRGARVDASTTIRNGPIAIVDGARVIRTPSPLTTFADRRSPFPPAPTILKVP